MLAATIAFIYQNLLSNVSLRVIYSTEKRNLTIIQLHWRRVDKTRVTEPRNDLVIPTTRQWPNDVKQMRQRNKEQLANDDTFQRAQDEIRSLRMMVDQMQHSTIVLDGGKNAKGEVKAKAKAKTRVKTRDALLF
jgi:hypothetical protein